LAGFRVAVLTITLLLLVGFEILSPPAHSQLTGLVCLAPAGATACPAPPVTVGAPVGSQLSVAVLISGSDAVNGFDITLKANHTILKPTAAFADATSLLAGGSVILDCIGGVLRSGSVCLQTDTADTIHFVLLGPQGFLSRPPTSGLLFTAVFNVTGTSGTSIGFQTGCSPTSVIGTSTCVVMSNGTIGIPAETVQSATYTQTPSPTFTLQADQTSIVVVRGSYGSATLSVTRLNGYSGTVSFATVMIPSVNHPPTTSFSPATLTLVSGGLGISVLSIQTTKNTTRNTYSLTVTASDSRLSTSLTIQIQVIH
jgi:hypothetical protein